MISLEIFALKIKGIQLIGKATDFSPPPKHLHDQTALKCSYIPLCMKSGDGVWQTV